jgi:hypothetical protein
MSCPQGDKRAMENPMPSRPSGMIDKSPRQARSVRRRGVTDCAHSGWCVNSASCSRVHGLALVAKSEVHSYPIVISQYRFNRVAIDFWLFLKLPVMCSPEELQQNEDEDV